MNIKAQVIVFAIFLLFGASRTGLCQSVGRLSPKQIFEERSDSIVKILTDKKTGTGFFVKNGLLVATCFHVVEGAKNIEVQGTTRIKGTNRTESIKWSVGFVYVNKAMDAAILKLTDETGRHHIPIGDFSKVSPGDEVCVIGNPLGFLDMSLSTGVISAKRTSRGVEYVQTTAAISPGSSGSPVFDGYGRAIGFADASFDEGQNLNLAINVDVLVKLWATSPIPINQFLGEQKSPRFPTKAPTISKVETEEVTRIYAAWYDSVLRERLLWDNWIFREMDHPAFSDTQFSALNSSRAESLVKKLEDVSQFMKKMDTGFWTEQDAKGFTGEIQETKSEIQDLARMHTLDHPNWFSTIRPESKTSADMLTSVARLETLIRRFFSYSEKKPWLDRRSFLKALSASSLFIEFGPTLRNISPDPALSQECYVGAITGYPRKIKAGDKITGVRRPDSQVFAAVSTWLDIMAFLVKNPDIVEVEVRYEKPLGQIGVEVFPVMR